MPLGWQKQVDGWFAYAWRACMGWERWVPLSPLTLEAACVQHKAVNLNVEALMSMAMDAGDDDDDAGGYWRSDPLYSADLSGAAIAALRDLAHADRAYFEAAMSELNDTERTFLQNLFEGPPATPGSARGGQAAKP